MTTYTLNMRDEFSDYESCTFAAITLNQARVLARAETRKWCLGGEWGQEGARIECWYEIADEAGERVFDDHVVVEIEPDHDALIRAAGGSTECKHDWTSADEGGCDSNPGYWSHGGTAMSFASHCRRCGLYRVEYRTGSQYNPGEHDSVEYQQPDHWCSDCESSDCTCKPVATLDEDRNLP